MVRTRGVGTPCLPPHPTHPVSGLRILRQGPWGGAPGGLSVVPILSLESLVMRINTVSSSPVRSALFVCLFSISVSTRHQQCTFHTNQNPSSPLFQEMLGENDLPKAWSGVPRN